MVIKLEKLVIMIKISRRTGNMNSNPYVQLIKSPDEYDEYKYLSGEEAIKILQSLSDGTHEAFIKPEGKNEKD